MTLANVRHAIVDGTLSPLLAAAVLAGGLAACNEPVDCGNGPGRCLQSGQKNVVQVDPNTYQRPIYKLEHPPPVDEPPVEEPPAEEPPAERPTAPSAPSAPAPAARKAPSEPQALNDPGKEVDMGAQVIHRSRRTPEALIRRIVNVAANHNLPGLKRFATARLQASMTESAAKHPKRFWKHIDRYAEAASEGFKLEERDGQEPGTKRLVITTRTGFQLNPIVAKDEKGWLFERF